MHACMRGRIKGASYQGDINQLITIVSVSSETLVKLKFYIKCCSCWIQVPYISFDLFAWEINKLYLIHLYGIIVINTQPKYLIPMNLLHWIIMCVFY